MIIILSESDKILSESDKKHTSSPPASGSTEFELAGIMIVGNRDTNLKPR